MKILFIGDISGKPGRRAVKEVLPDLRKKEKIDFVIANCENAAGGRGVTIEKINELSSYGIDFFTSGEHFWDIEKFSKQLAESDPPISRPINYENEESLLGKGIQYYDLGKFGKLIVITFLGQTFMRENVRSPFWKFDEVYEKNKPEFENSTVIVDFHAEATSEKITFANYVRDKVSAVLGTHTHVGTVDTRIVGEGTAFVTDVGMCGPYDASLWVKFENITHNFKYPYKQKFEIEEEGRVVFNSVLLEISSEKSDFLVKKCNKIERIDRILQ